MSGLGIGLELPETIAVTAENDPVSILLYIAGEQTRVSLRLTEATAEAIMVELQRVLSARHR